MTYDSLVLLVITQESVLYYRYVRKQLIEGYPYSFEQGDRSYLQVTCTVMHNWRGPQLDRGELSVSDVRMLFRQGEGTTLAPLCSTLLEIKQS